MVVLYPHVTRLQPFDGPFVVLVDAQIAPALTQLASLPQIATPTVTVTLTRPTSQSQLLCWLNYTRPNKHSQLIVTLTTVHALSAWNQWMLPQILVVLLHRTSCNCHVTATIATVAQLLQLGKFCFNTVNA